LQGANVTDLITKEIPGEIPGEKKSKHSYVNGIKNKGITGENLVLSKLPATKEILEEAFVKQGFAASSAGSTASRLFTKGKIKRDKNGKYLLND